jgi:hypothetical protein
VVYEYDSAYGHHSSTAQEGVLRGSADGLRAVGETSVYVAEAERRHQDAVRQSLENRLRLLQVRQEMERMILAHRTAIREMRRASTLSHQQDSASAEAIAMQLDPVVLEKRALNKLHLAETLLEKGREEAGRRWLEDLVAEFPETQAAEQARMLLGASGSESGSSDFGAESPRTTDAGRQLRDSANPG